MNFFKLYIGDYQRDTAHLSITEHGAYLLMLQHYYATEKPLPSGKALHRMLRAQDKAERDAIDVVAAQFWTATDAGLVNERADVEITKAGTQADTNARIAREREERRKAAREEHERSTNRATNDQPNHSQTPDSPTDATHPPEISEATPPHPSADADGPPRRVAEPPPGLPDCPHQAVLALWAEVLPAMPQHLPSQWRGTRAVHLRARWRETAAEKRWASEADGLAYLRKLFAYVGQSRFLTGRAPVRDASKPPFLIELEWLVAPGNWAKVIEGKYHQEAA